MEIYNYQQAFGAWDKTTPAMRRAVAEWFRLYYRDRPEAGEDPCQRIAYTVVNKLVKTVFSEYNASSESAFWQGVLRNLDSVRKEAVQLALVGGEVYLKPCLSGSGFEFGLIPRDNVLIFGRNSTGVPVDVGTMEKCTLGNAWYTLLERRRVDAKGYLTIENKLYKSFNRENLGNPVPLQQHPDYAGLSECYTYGVPVGSVGLVRLKTPMLNCVDGSQDGVSVYAAAVGLIHNIDRNEAQLSGEFSRGESRVFLSADLLDENKHFSEHLFMGLDDDPERVGITVFAPQLRDQSFLNRKQEYLRNVESIIGLQRGMLSDVNVEKRTATEISASQGEHNLTVIDFQQMWEQGARDALALCAVLAKVYGLDGAQEAALQVDWGNGVLYDEDKLWQEYRDMVSSGLLKPEIALGWRFGMPARTPEEQAKIRDRFLPEEE